MCFWLLYLSSALQSKSSLPVFHLIAYAYQCHRQTSTCAAYRANFVLGLFLCLFHEIATSCASSPLKQYSLSRNNLICCDFPTQNNLCEQHLSNHSVILFRLSKEIKEITSWRKHDECKAQHAVAVYDFSERHA